MKTLRAWLNLFRNGGIHVLLFLLVSSSMAADFDGDGLPDSWQSQYGFVTNGYASANLVGWWQMDGPSGVGDRSGHQLTGAPTAFSASPFVPGLFSNALSFSSSAQVAFPVTNASLNATNSLTMSAWVRAVATNQTVSVARWLDANGMAWQMGIHSNGVGQIQFISASNQVQSVRGTSGALFLYDNQWHHLAAVYDKPTAQATVYVDGNPEANGIISNWSLTKAASFSLGALQQAELPYGWFMMDDNAATVTVKNSGTGGQDGVASGNTSTLSQPGKINTALAFNGLNQFVNLDAFMNGIKTDTTGSFAFWVKPTSNGTLLSFGGPVAYFRIASINANVNLTIAGILYSAVNHSTPVGSLPLGSWSHVACVQDGTGPKIYINGVMQTLTQGVAMGPANWFNYNSPSAYWNGRLGAFNNTTDPAANTLFFTGSMDDVRYFKKALTLAEVTTLISGVSSGVPSNSPFLLDEVRLYNTALSPQGILQLPITYSDFDNDGLSSLQEYQSGSSPLDFYNGRLPTLSIISGDNQSGNTNTFLSTALTVQATTNGVILKNAPIQFSVTGGGGQLSPALNGALTSTLMLNTISNGRASAYFKLPGTVGTNAVTVLATSGAASTSLVFKEVSTDGNRAPVAIAQSLTTGVDLSKSITLTGTDADNNLLTYTVLTQPIHGTLSGTVPVLTYTPAAGYLGSDSFTFRVSDGKLNSAAATVTLTVRNPTPVTGSLTNQTWTEPNSPFLVTEPLTISNLTINPGVVVLFQSNGLINASGAFKAVGQKAKPILFQPVAGNTNGWKGVVVGNAVTGSSLAWCGFKGARATALKLQESAPAISNCWFTGNQSVDHGGALSVTLAKGNLVIVGSSFGTNSAVYTGGAVKAVLGQGTLIMNDCVFTANKSNPNSLNYDSSGGALMISGHSTLTRCVFQKNAAQAYTIYAANGRYARGGAIWCDTGTNSFRACTFKENACNMIGHGSTPDYSYPHGGAIYQGSGVLNLVNCLVANQSLSAINNQIRLGSALYVAAGTLSAANCTFVQNQAAPAIHNQSGAASVINSILYDNNGNAAQYSGAVTLNYCDIYGGAVGGTGNFNLNPIFNETFRVITPSPAIDAGNPDPAYNDVSFPPSRGAVRNDLGHFGGPGVIYWNAGVPVILTHPMSQPVGVGRSTTLNVVTIGAPTLTYQWQKNGVDISGATASTYTTPALGTSDSGSRFRVIVKNSLGSVISSEAVLSVPASGPTPVGGLIAGQTWDSSMSPLLVTNDLWVDSLTIQPGVTIQFQSNVLMKVDGVIKVLGTQASPVLFQSAPGNTNGWLGVSLQNSIAGSEFHWCVFKDARRSALKLKENAPIVDHCSFYNNSSPDHGGAIHASLSKGSFNLPGCIFTNNTAFNTGGAVTMILSNGTLTADHCIFNGNMTDPAFAPYTDTEGGALKIFGNSVLTRCDFSNNQSRAMTYYSAYGRFGKGGALWTGMGTNSVRGCSFIGNTVYVAMGPSTPDMSYSYGGAIYQDSGSLTLFNDLFAKNSLVAGGRNLMQGSAVCVATGGMYAANCSFIQNAAAPAVHNQSGGAEIVNSILFLNNQVEHPISPSGWAGVYWQNPGNNWGTVQDGGFNMTGAKKVKFMARAETPGAKLQFLCGGIAGAYPDSFKIETPFITLSNTWQNYEINLTTNNLSKVAGGFGFVLKYADNSKPTVFYLDNIVYDNGGTPPLATAVPMLPLPHAIYRDANNRYIPSGWVGDIAALTFTDKDATAPGEGAQSVKVTYTPSGTNGWAGVFWQGPEKNWGTDIQGGYNMTGAKKVKFMARAETQGLKVKFSAGGIAGPFPDTFRADSPVLALTTGWQSYEIDLTGRDLTRVIGAFSFVISKTDNPAGGTFYLDNVIYDNGGPTLPLTAAPTPPLPYAIYKDAHDKYAPSGWMGDAGALTLRDTWHLNAGEGARCIRVGYLVPSWGPQLSGNFKVEYSDVYGEFPAPGNIDLEPIFDANYNMLPSSPTIDAGNPASGYNDVLFPPALGSSRNDMGHRGGAGGTYWQ